MVSIVRYETECKPGETKFCATEEYRMHKNKTESARFWVVENEAFQPLLRPPPVECLLKSLLLAGSGTNFFLSFFPPKNRLKKPCFDLPLLPPDHCDGGPYAEWGLLVVDVAV